MSKLRDKLRRWLYGKEFDEIEAELLDLQKECDWLKRAVHSSVLLLKESKQECNDIAELVRQCQQTMNSICDVGVDISARPDSKDYNWAVVCIHGKVDYVKFIPLSPPDVRTVAQFLKQFQYSPRMVDSPFAFRKIIEDLIWTI